MISLAGNCLLIFSTIVSILTIFVKYTKESPKIDNRIRVSKFDISNFGLWQRYFNKSHIFWISSIAIIMAFFLLVFAFVSSDFSVKNVFLNSSTIKPLIYKIAGSWASHEGSILLYTSLLSFISSLYIKITKHYHAKSKNLQITILAFIQTLFLCFIYYTSNPFDNFKFTPEQGLGLNPALQDKALSIHPPLLYMGYVSYITLYVNGILLLLVPTDRKIIVKNSLYLSGFALLMLASGIGLGSWWAYRELGWGGYWFFDPVENISLMPWIAGIALHHFLLITHKSGKFLKPTIITSFLAFLLTLYGLFFVRSGIISSVHSFAFSAERGIYLFAICIILTLLALIAFIIRKEDDGISSANIKIFSPLTIYDKSIIIGNVLWIIALLSLFIAVIYPIYQSCFYQNEVAIDPEYFHKIFIPIFIPLMLIASITPYAQNKNGFLRKLIYSLIPLLFISVIHHYAEFGIISASIIFVSTYLMTQMLDLVLIETKYFKTLIDARKLPLILGHFSFGLLAFAITINVIFSKEIEFIGKIGESVSDKSFIVKLNNMKFSSTEVYYRQIAEFSIQDIHGNIVILRPENRLYKIENSLSQETDIYSYLTHDIVASLSKINSETIHAIIYYRPMIYFIWFAVFLIAATFFIYSLLLRKTATSHHQI